MLGPGLECCRFVDVIHFAAEPRIRAYYQLLLLVLSITQWAAAGVTAAETQRETYNYRAALARGERKLDEAEKLYRKAIQEAEAQKIQDSTLATSLGGLAMVLWNRGQHAEAEALFKQSLQLHEKVSGTDSPRFKSVQADLMGFYRSQAKYADLEPLYKRALALDEQKYGVKHPQITGSLHNLGDIYEKLEKYKEAEQQYKRALEIIEQYHGPDYPALDRPLEKLITLYENQARYAEAETLSKRLLAIQEKTVGGDIFPALSLLRVQYQRQQKYDEAIVTIRRVIELQEMKLGPDHPSLTIHRRALALLLEIQGQTDEAAKLEAQVLEDLKSRPRSRDAGDGPLLTKMGDESFKKERYAVAESTYFAAADAYERVFGPNHADVARSWQNVSKAVAKQGREKEAAAYTRRAERAKAKP